MTPAELEQIDPKPIIIDLRLEEDHASGSIPGSYNNCIFETAFVGRMPVIATELDAPVLVYGADARSYECKMALPKLSKLGYTKVTVLEGGFQAWGDAKLPIIGTNEAPAVPEAKDGNHEIDCVESSIHWTGRNLLNKHVGSVGISRGDIELAGGLIVAGSFEIDMSSICATDLEGEQREGLNQHLKSDDFFDVENFPAAILRVLGSAPVDGNTIGGPNLQIDAELTIRDSVVPVRFDVACGIAPNGQLAAQGLFSIDRTLWGVLYGSGKFFHRLGMHLVNDLIDIEVKIVTEV